MIRAALASAMIALAAMSVGASDDSKEYAWMDLGKKLVGEKLKDPASAQFRNVYFHRGADNVPITCGEVNSKNSLGGYGGFQRFVSAGRSELTFLQEQVEGFDDVWRQFCK